MVYAQVDSNIVDPLNNRFTSLSSIFGVVYNIALGSGIALTIIYLILGGIKYIMSQGDKANTMVAREWLTNAIIGFVIVIAAMSIRSIIVSALGGNIDSARTTVGI